MSAALSRLRQIPQHQRVVEVVADEAVAFEALVGVAGGDRQVAGGHADGQGAAGLRRGAGRTRLQSAPQWRNSLLHDASDRSLHEPSARRLWFDRHRRQVLKPALRLHEALHLGRHRPRVEVVHDKDHHRLAAFELVQLGQQLEPLFVVELVEDLADQRLGLGAFVVPPIRSRRAPNRPCRPA